MSRRQRLSIFSPSPTTVSYTVSTASGQESYLSLALHLALYALRIIIGLIVFLCLGVKLTTCNVLGLEILNIYLRALPWSQAWLFTVISFYFVFRRYHTGIYMSVVFFELDADYQ